ncbi:MAG TPA: hypothetical protein VGB82_04140 [Alphaproteobacteria bacterium]
MNVLEDLWRAGIGFSVKGEAHTGFSAELCDEGGTVLVATAEPLKSWDELRDWLVHQVKLHRPQSDFAKAHAVDKV